MAEIKLSTRFVRRGKFTASTERYGLSFRIHIEEVQDRFGKRDDTVVGKVDSSPILSPMLSVNANSKKLQWMMVTYSAIAFTSMWACLLSELKER